MIFILICVIPITLVLISGSVFATSIVIACIVIVLIIGLDFEKAYVEFNNDEIYVVDYYFLIKKRKTIQNSRYKHP